MARALRLGSVQLHGAESPAEVAELGRKHRVIKAIQVKRGFRPGFAWLVTAPRMRLLLDGFARGLHGGTGRTLDWKLARAARRYGRIILAGGLTPENIAEAIRVAEPYAVDVASGVEARPGTQGSRAIARVVRGGRIGREVGFACVAPAFRRASVRLKCPPEGGRYSNVPQLTTLRHRTI